MTATVFLAILAKQKEKVLPLFLKTIQELDYPKDHIVLYVRTNNNTDRTKDVLDAWLEKHSAYYKTVLYDSSDIDKDIQKYGVHEWNGERFKALARIRQDSLDVCYDLGCDYYFVVDVDNFIYPETLKALIEANKPIVGPLLRYAVADDIFPDTPEDQERVGSHRCRYYANYHYRVDSYGSIINEPVYYQLLYQVHGFRGIIEVDCVHCTYLIKREYIPRLSYLEDSNRWEYMVFSENARKARINQYLDNREIYGILTLTENAPLCEWLYEHLKDPDLREERYLQHNPQDVFYDPDKTIMLSED